MKSILQDSVQFRSSYNRFLKQRKIHANSGRSVKVITPALKQMKSWWTTNYGHPERAFFENPKLLGRQIGPNYQSLVHVHFNQPLFLQKTKPIYPNPKYLFGIGIWIWIWAAKNQGFSHRVSVVRVVNNSVQCAYHYYKVLMLLHSGKGDVLLQRWQDEVGNTA